MNLKQLSVAAVAAAAIFGSGWFGGSKVANVPATSPILIESQAQAEAASWSMVCDGVVICQPFTPAPSLTPSRTPTSTPKSPTVSATPLEVTPIAPTPVYPRYVKAEREYIPLARLLIRKAPLKADNWTGAYAQSGTRYMMYHLREYADGSVWGCMDDIAPTACARWIAIRADLSPVDGVLENYAKEAPELDG